MPTMSKPFYPQKYFPVGKFNIAEMQPNGILQEIVCTVSAANFFETARAQDIRDKLVKFMNENQDIFAIKERAS